jgi:hypothetical protein
MKSFRFGFSTLMAAWLIASTASIPSLAEDDDDPWAGYEHAADAQDAAPEDAASHEPLDVDPSEYIQDGGELHIVGTRSDDPWMDDEAPQAADPVVLATGELIHQEVDLKVAGPGAASLVFRRTYRSRSDLRSPMGSNWFHNHDIRVLWGRGATKASLPRACGELDDTCVVLRREGVDAVYLRPRGSSFYAAIHRDGSALRVSYDSSTGKPSGATLEFPDGLTMRFNDAGYVTRVADRFNNALTYEYASTEFNDAWDRLCRSDDVVPVPAGFPRRLCDTLHAALGERLPVVSEVNMADRTGAPGFTLTNPESAFSVGTQRRTSRDSPGRGHLQNAHLQSLAARASDHIVVHSC